MASSHVSLAMRPRGSLGRVTLNPIKHIDPVGTILLPGFLVLLGSPFLFGMPNRFRLTFDRSEIRAAAWSG